MAEYPRKKESELAEARGHLIYFQQAVSGLNFAIKRMQEDLKVCEKSEKLWEGRIAKMEGSMKAPDSPVAEGKLQKQPRTAKEGDRGRIETWPGEEAA
jgi:hypothetical protein